MSNVQFVLSKKGLGDNVSTHFKCNWFHALNENVRVSEEEEEEEKKLLSKYLLKILVSIANASNDVDILNSFVSPRPWPSPALSPSISTMANTAIQEGWAKENVWKIEIKNSYWQSSTIFNANQ